jgi:metal-responsive CopG/Arc/MetJ family transcriptional regulator
MSNLIDKLANEIMMKRSEILDDFIKAYVASRTDRSAIDLLRKGKLELVETIESPIRRTYTVRIKRGRERKSKK